jgi:hypothetical protein
MGGRSDGAVAPGARTVDIPQYVSWRDPAEGSFTLDVPDGWTVTGGVKWNTIYSPRQWVKARSPDNRILVFYGDPDLLPRFVPNPEYTALGWRAGQVVRNTAGTSVFMEPYLTGEDFAREFSAQTSCDRPSPRATYRLQTETNALARAYADFSTVADFQITAGEFLYSCGGFDGYTHAVTMSFSPQGGDGISTWDIFAIGGFTAAGGTGNYEVGRRVLLHMASSLRIDPDWLQKTQAALGSANGAMIQASNTAANIMLHSAQLSMAAHDSSAQKWSDIILGQQHMCDDLNRCSETTNACDYIWDLAGKFECGPSDGSPPDSRNWRLTHRQE